MYNMLLLIILQGSSAYDLKDSAEAWRSLAAHQSFPYDPMSLYPYGAGYDTLTLLIFGYLHISTSDVSVSLRSRV